jgi:hypothetical protein
VPAEIQFLLPRSERRWEPVSGSKFTPRMECPARDGNTISSDLMLLKSEVILLDWEGMAMITGNVGMKVIDHQGSG